MAYAIDKLANLDLIGLSADNDFDVGAHAVDRLVYVVRTGNGAIHLQPYKLDASGHFSSIGAAVVVGNGSRPRVLVFDDHRIVVTWLDAASALQARGYLGTANGDLFASNPVTVETTVTTYELAPIGVTRGPSTAPTSTVVVYAFREFALTTTSVNGGYKVYLGVVGLQQKVSVEAVAAAGAGDKVALACAGGNEIHDGKDVRKALTLCRTTDQIKTAGWRIGVGAVAALATATETRALGSAVLHGLSISQGNDFFASVVWPGASNSTSRLQLLAMAANGSTSVYASAEIAEIPVFARLHPWAGDAAVAYRGPNIELTVAAWRFAAPPSGAARTVLASKASGAQQPTQIRITSLVLEDVNAPIDLVTLSRAGPGVLVLVSWRLKQTLVA